MGKPGAPVSRRDFLQAAAAQAAALSLPGAAVACSSSGSKPAFDVNQVDRVAVHPSLGVARVGNSELDFYLGPEVPGATPESAKGFKDEFGALIPQGARFRLYAYDKAGNVLGEVTAALGTIKWTVSVANKKPAWYVFNTPLDLPIATPQPRRNSTILGADREALIAAAEETVEGAGAEPRFLSATSSVFDLKIV